MKKTMKTAAVAILLVLICAMTVFAQDKDVQSPLNPGCRIYTKSQITWNQNGSEWSCTYNRTGELLKDRWMALYEKSERYTFAEWYHFDENGVMQTGWFETEGKTFYLKPDGRAVRGECVETIDGHTFVFGWQHYILKDINITIDGKNYTADENGYVISGMADKTQENIKTSGQEDQLTYLNTYRKQKGISDLMYDSELTEVAKAAYGFGENITLSDVYSLASGTGHHIRHVAYIRASAAKDGSYVFLTEDAIVNGLQNIWYTRAGFYESDGTIMIIMAAYDQEETVRISADEAQGKWINENGRFKYQKTDDTFAVNCWIRNPGDGKWYHFDENGLMQIGWFQDSDGKWYYLSTDTGEMLTSTTIDGYVIGADGVMLTDH